MQTLNARGCPRCDFFLGYSTTRPSFDRRRTALIGACLNCGYRLPIHAILRSQRPPVALSQRAAPILTVIEGPVPRSKRLRQAPAGSFPRHCARELRAVGQALEQLQLKNFNLKRDGRSYLIWHQNPAGSPGRSRRPRKTWHDSTAPDYRFRAEDVERIERDGISRRSKHFQPVDGHKLSHLLRTLGTQIDRRGQRLLGITWRAEAVSVIVEGARGRRRIEPIPTDLLYDLWVRMYLRRAH